MRLLLLCLLALPAYADHYRSPLPVLHMQGWELIAQSFDAGSGELVGGPRLIGKYRTVEQCSIAQAGHVERTKAVGPKWLATVWFCRHRGDDVV